MQKFLVIFAAAFCGVFGRPSEVTLKLTNPEVSDVLTHYHTQDSAGQYSYSYSSPLSSKSEVRSLDGTTNGAYKYVDPDGKIQSVEYSSDTNGFQVKSATNLPESPKVPDLPKLEAPTPVSDTPEVVEARSRHLEALKQAEMIATQEPAKIETTVINPAPVLAPSIEFYRLSPNNLQVLPFSSAPLVALNYEIPGASISYATYQAPLLPGFSFQIAGNDAGLVQQQAVQENLVKEEDDTVTVEAKSADVKQEEKQDVETEKKE